jgi:hypothetical protein
LYELLVFTAAVKNSGVPAWNLATPSITPPNTNVFTIPFTPPRDCIPMNHVLVVLMEEYVALKEQAAAVRI